VTTISTSGDSNRRTPMTASATRRATFTASLTLTDGSVIRTDPRGAADVLGVDADGDLVVPLYDGSDESVPLTSCCHATGKGWMDDDTAGVVCRSCFEWVDDKYGTTTSVAVAVRAVDAIEQVTP
jgi:hypothetical protein